MGPARLTTGPRCGGIEQARDFAWTAGQTLWAVRGSALEQAFTDRLDRMVQLTSRLLLGAGR